MEKDDEVFLDAEEEVNPRRSGRKRRSTAGSCTTAPCVGKKQKTTMPTRHSPKRTGGAGPQPPTGADQDAFWVKMGGMFEGLETRMKRETDQMKAQLSMAVDSVGDLGVRMEQTEKRLQGLVEEVNSIVDKKLADLPVAGALPLAESPGSSYAAMLASGLEKHPPTTWKSSRSPGRRREDRYWECRRTLRLRPIPEGDIIEQVRAFMTDHLKLSQTFMESVGDIKASRVPSGPAAKVKDEVVVAYQTTDIRDAVKSAARNLAGKGSDYGVRLELPDHLKSAMKSLQAVSYEIKKKYPLARRNVLFDDETMDLVLDFCVAEGASWRRMTSAQAKERKKKIPGPSNKLPLEDNEIDRLLDTSTNAAGDESDQE